jgi:hypothetical protein
MKISTTSFSLELREPLLALLWRQWSALGVAGHVAGGGRALVDPEALVLASTVFARHDVRLFDEMLDWLRSNGTWINVMRLAHLQREFELGDRTVLGAVAQYLAQDSSNLKWKSLAKAGEPAIEPRPLFPHLPVPGYADETFRHWGWLRAPIEHRGLSRPPRPNQPATFLLKLRALFGRQSRAEVLAWLLTHDSGHPAQIARQTGYFRGSVQNVLNELEVSGHVYSTRQGREKLFAIRHDQWRFLLTWDSSVAAAFPRWLPWPVLFGLIRGVHDLVDQPEFAGRSAHLQSMELNRVLSPLLARLATEGYVSALAGGPDDTGAAIAQVVHEVRSLIADLGN